MEMKVVGTHLFHMPTAGWLVAPIKQARDRLKSVTRSVPNARFERENVSYFDNKSYFFNA
jgi:hypothetical protein